jgi:bacterioferritin (cytochrome b1)
MSRWNTLKKALRGLVKGWTLDGRKELMAWLLQEYVEEEKASAQFERHAKRMQYPQFRERLLQIAQDERKHAEWLKQRIRFFGGAVPRISFSLKEGWNSWEHLRLDLDEERHCIGDMEDHLVRVERVDPETARGLRRILEEEKKHRDLILDMLMRSDPQAVRPI